MQQVRPEHLPVFTRSQAMLTAVQRTALGEGEVWLSMRTGEPGFLISNPDLSLTDGATLHILDSVCSSVKCGDSVKQHVLRRLEQVAMGKAFYVLAINLTKPAASSIKWG